MNNETIQFALQFLDRVQLQGREVNAFNQVITELLELQKTNNQELQCQSIKEI